MAGYVRRKLIELTTDWSVAEQGSEEDRFIGNSKAFRYRVLSNLCNFHLAVASLALDHEECILTAYNSFDSFKHHSSQTNKKKSKKSPVKNLFKCLIQICTFIIITYASLKALYINYLRFEYDRTLISWSPKANRNATRQIQPINEKCAREEEIYFATEEDRRINERLLYLRGKLESINIVVNSQAGSVSVYLGWAGFIPLIFFLAGFAYLKLVYKDGCQLDYLLFLLKPIRAKQRIREEIGKICIELADKASNFPPSRRGDCFTMPNKKRFDSIKFTQLLFKIQLADSIQPLNLTGNVHLFLIGVNIFILLSIDFGGVASSAAAIVRIFWIELFERVQHRLSLLDCLQYSNSTLIRNHIVLKQLNDELDLMAYKNYENYSSSFTQLALIEAKLIFSFKTWLPIVEAVALAMLNSFVVSAYACIFLSYYVDKSIWVYQIIRQFDKCKDLMTSMIKIERRNGKRGEKLAILNDHESAHEEQAYHSSSKQLENDCELKLIEVYLNFELFRRSHYNKMKLMNFLLLQAAITTTESLILCYSVARNLNTPYKFAMLTQASLVFAMMNVYIISSSIFETFVERVMKRALNLVTISCTLKSLQESIIICLLRRQLLEAREVKRLYAPGVFGIRTSADKLLTVNTWLMILYYVVLNE